MYISTKEMVISIICNACGVLGLILWAIEAHKSNADQRTQSVESVENNGDIIVRSNLYPFRVVEADRKTEPTGYKLKPVEVEPQTEVYKCPKCGKDTPTEFDECVWCLSPKDEQSGKE